MVSESERRAAWVVFAAAYMSSGRCAVGSDKSLASQATRYADAMIERMDEKFGPGSKEAGVGFVEGEEAAERLRAGDLLERFGILHRLGEGGLVEMLWWPLRPGDEWSGHMPVESLGTKFRFRVVSADEYGEACKAAWACHREKGGEKPVAAKVGDTLDGKRATEWIKGGGFVAGDHDGIYRFDARSGLVEFWLWINKSLGKGEWYPFPGESPSLNPGRTFVVCEDPSKPVEAPAPKHGDPVEKREGLTWAEACQAMLQQKEVMHGRYKHRLNKIGQVEQYDTHWGEDWDMGVITKDDIEATDWRIVD